MQIRHVFCHFKMSCLVLNLSGERKYYVVVVGLIHMITEFDRIAYHDPNLDRDQKN